MLLVETGGYKTEVKKLLNIVMERTEAHVEGCDVCKSESDGEMKVQPRKSVVSNVMKGLLKYNRIFVSKRASNYFDENRDGGVIKHSKAPFI